MNAGIQLDLGNLKPKFISNLMLFFANFSVLFINFILIYEILANFKLSYQCKIKRGKIFRRPVG